jgi:two-component system sensor histidine kinase UhpB
VTDNVGDERLPPDVESTCFRVVQEAVTNAIRHAGATRLDVRLARTAERVGVDVIDDGAGFDVDDARHGASDGTSLGLLGMEERVRLLDGQITVASRPGAGTTISLSLPLRARGDG